MLIIKAGRLTLVITHPNCSKAYSKRCSYRQPDGPVDVARLDRASDLQLTSAELRFPPRLKETKGGSHYDPEEQRENEDVANDRCTSVSSHIGDCDLADFIAIRPRGGATLGGSRSPDPAVA